MKITFSPQRRDDSLTLSKMGDVLTINGDTLDLSVIPDGATIPAAAIDSEWIVGHVSRVDGTLRLTLILPHAAGAPDYMCFPEPITVTANGAIDVPTWTPAEEPEAAE